MNTARSFGPAAVTGFPESSQWIVSFFPPFFFFLGTSVTSSWPYDLLRVRAKELERWRSSHVLTHARMDVTPLDPHDTPLRIDADERDNHLTHDLKCFFLTVLAGPIPGRTSGHCVLRLFETVRHVTLASLLPPFPFVGSLSLRFFFRKVWTLTPEDCIFPCPLPRGVL
jgi:hypothetical protein